MLRELLAGYLLDRVLHFQVRAALFHVRAGLHALILRELLAGYLWDRVVHFQVRAALFHVRAGLHGLVARRGHIGDTQAQHDTTRDDTDDFRNGYHGSLLGSCKRSMVPLERTQTARRIGRNVRATWFINMMPPLSLS